MSIGIKEDIIDCMTVPMWQYWVLNSSIWACWRMISNRHPLKSLAQIITHCSAGLVPIFINAIFTFSSKVISIAYTKGRLPQVTVTLIGWSYYLKRSSKDKKCMRNASVYGQNRLTMLHVVKLKRAYSQSRAYKFQGLILRLILAFLTCTLRVLGLLVQCTCSLLHSV